jgi:hypothetical protein
VKDYLFPNYLHYRIIISYDRS